MIRHYLENDSQVRVRNKAGDSFTYIIKGIAKRGNFGASCLCYQAFKEESPNSYKTVLLKEFYPSAAGGREIRREPEGRLLFPENEELNIRRENFEKGVGCMREFVRDANIKEYICAETDIEVLYGNGTVYCENKFVPAFFSWREAGDDKTVKMDELIQTAMGTIRFLRCLHTKGRAYMDLKPEDVLIPEREMGEMDFERPLFYDFNSILELNKEYKMKDIQIRTTEKYQPDDFAGDLDEEREVSLRTENMMYGKVLEDLAGKKAQTVSESVMETMKTLIEHLKHPEKDAMTETEIEERLENIRNQICDEEYEKEYKQLPGKIKKYRFFRRVFMMLAIAAYAGMAFLMSYMYICADRMKQIANRHQILSPAETAAALLAVTVALTALKVLNWRIAERIANTTVSVKYYHSDIRTGEYNTFRHGFRKKTTFQDKSVSNQRRQKRRRILWSVLFAGIVTGLLFSIKLKSFPVFLAWGFVFLIWFTYADFLPAEAEFYQDFVSAEKNQKGGRVSAKRGKALFYMKEYLEADRSFDRNKELYTQNNRDLMRLKETVWKNCFAEERREKGISFSKLRAFFQYELRWKLVTEGQKNRLDLQYAPLQIRHIYKMAFDRLRNKQMIMLIVVTLITALAIALDFIAFTGTWITYFKLPKEVYSWLTMFCILGASAVSIFQVACSMQSELLVSELSYKSRYVIDSALNDELVKDIAAGFILPVDVARGTWQYEGYINTMMNQRERRKLKMAEQAFNRPLFHHTEFTNRSRLALTVWLIFGCMLAVLWQIGAYGAVPWVLVFMSLFHLVFRKFVLPKWGEKALVKEIEDVIKEKSGQ